MQQNIMAKVHDKIHTAELNLQSEKFVLGIFNKSFN